MTRLRKAAIPALGLLTGLAAFDSGPVEAAWQPQKTIEFIVPAGTGGGADQMARMIQGIIQKHNLLNQSVVVINKAGGAGAEGFLDVVGSKGEPHKIIITLSNLFTTPLATKVPFTWKDMTPVSMLALDNFVLWVNASTPYQTATDYINAVKAAEPSKFSMGGTGAKQEDQIITAAIEQSASVKFSYIPFKGGGAVATQLVGGHITSTVNNPIEAVSHWDAGTLRPLCVFGAAPMPVEKWNKIPTCKSSGLDVEYQMLRGIFTTPGATAEQVAFYVDLFKKVAETPEWKDFLEKGAFTTTMMSGDEFNGWLTSAEELHKTLMTKAGFLAN
ncbi:MAG: tripartite tricarboxylate transporter substrate binding protein [Rhodomicrobium sp.]|nr:tripartite tricarboxylate transporter substrate binding protein [Rhodomicrobium sp.]